MCKLSFSLSKILLFRFKAYTELKSSFSMLSKRKLICWFTLFRKLQLYDIISGILFALTGFKNLLGVKSALIAMKSAFTVSIRIFSNFSHMNKAVIIVAGGSGSRMQSELPKQFIKWCGKPILMHTIQRFVDFDEQMKIVLVLPQNQLELWNELCSEYNFSAEHTVAFGGKTRFESVKNGLEKLSQECLVAVHDGVRPLVSEQTLKNCFDTAAKHGSAIPVIDAIESIREVGEFGSRAVARANYKMVQTPQVFVLSKLREAYQQPYRDFFTDDASVYEAAGNAVTLTEGNRENIKITTPMDLEVKPLPTSPKGRNPDTD